MIRRKTISDAMYEAMRLAATRLPPDVQIGLEKVLDEESEALSRHHMEISLKNAQKAEKGEGLVCADTGYPLFFVTAGNQTRIEGGFGCLQKAAEEATARATGDSYLRPTMVDPLSRKNPDTNVGPAMPAVDLKFMGDDDGLKIIAAPKGGGSEIFGTSYRMMYPSDGKEGIFKFAIDAIRDSCYAGKICPPAIVGIGIGGTSDICMKLAKQAALLRPVGKAHPDQSIADMENQLLNATRDSGLGPMGAAGKNIVMDVNVETAMTHTAALPVAVNAQCLVGRRWSAYVTNDNEISYTGEL